MLTKYRGEIYLILGAIVFSLNGVVSTVALQEISAMRLTQVRCLGAFLLLFLYTFARHRDYLRASAKEVPQLIAYGVVGYALVQLGYFTGIQRGLPLSFVLLLEFTAPIWIVLWIKYVRKGFVPNQMWLAIALSLTGLLLLAQIWKGFAFDTVGFLAALGAAFAMATYFLLGKKISARPSLGLVVWGLGVASATWLLLMPIWDFPFEFLTTDINAMGRGSDYLVKGWALLLWIIVMGTIVPYLFVVGGLRLLSESTSSIIGLLEPVLAGAFAWFWLGQSWSGIQLLGGAIIIVGIYLADHVKSEAR